MFVGQLCLESPICINTPFRGTASSDYCMHPVLPSDPLETQAPHATLYLGGTHDVILDCPSVHPTHVVALGASVMPLQRHLRFKVNLLKRLVHVLVKEPRTHSVAHSQLRNIYKATCFLIIRQFAQVPHLVPRRPRTVDDIERKKFGKRHREEKIWKTTSHDEV